jgi:hypothetical protein
MRHQPDILSERATELTTDIVYDEVAISNASCPIGTILNEGNFSIANAASNVTTNLTESSLNRDAVTEAEPALRAKGLPATTHETFMLGKAVEDEKACEIMRLTKPMMNVSKQVFISNIV